MKAPWEMTRQEYTTGEPTRGTQLAEAWVGVRGAFKKTGDVDYVIGERFERFGQTMQIVGHNDLNVPYTVKVHGTKLGKTQYAGNPYEVHEVVVRKALREGKAVPPEVLKDYPQLVGQPPLPVHTYRAEGEALASGKASPNYGKVLVTFSGADTSRTNALQSFKTIAQNRGVKVVNFRHDAGCSCKRPRLSR